MNTAIVLQVIGAFGGLAGVAAIVNVAFQRRKTAAEAQSIAQDASTKVIQNLTVENKRLQQQIDDYDTDMTRIRHQLRELSDRVSVYDMEMGSLRVLAMSNINWSRRANEALSQAIIIMQEHHIETGGMEIEAPPDPTMIINKFAYIESRVKD